VRSGGRKVLVLPIDLLALTVPALVAVSVLESTNHFPVTPVPEAVIRAVMLPTNTSRIVAEKIASSVAALRQS
jgi:hypothetical protein